MSAPTSQHRALLEKWLGWLETITDDIVDMHADRRVWRDLVAMLESNTGIPERLWMRTWITQQYVPTIAVAVRRQAEVRDGVVSLGRLLDALMRNPGVVTRDWYVARFGPADQHLQAVAHHNFNCWAPSGANRVDAAVLCDRLTALRAITDKVIPFVDMRIAHHDQSADPAPFTFGDLNAAIDHLGELLREMYLLLKVASLLQVEPTFVRDWRRAFAVPWLPPEEVREWQEIQRGIQDEDTGKSQIGV